ncbi:MAG: FAD-dependent oxidoreductase [Nitrospinae bacterium]|nr:FAD-dependent oxidoreductase [Nitrospinota bacterium]
MASETKRAYDFLYDQRSYQGVPCQTNCPVHTDVEGYISLIREGDFEAAHRLIRETNPFPAVCGRICQHWCERGCNRRMIDQSLSIMSLKRSATDYSKDTFKLPEQRYNTLERVAIIGAGPAGLTAAHDLAKLGYRPTVFEMFPHPGGMMRYGIPAYRLPREVIDFEVEYIKRLGVEIRYNTAVGRDIHFHEMQAEFKAILIAAGAHKAVHLKVPGETLKGVYHGCTFMQLVNLGKSLPPMSGKTVAVIGGGFTAMDVSRSSIRLGAKKVYIVYRRTRAEIPVNEKEITEAEDEGVEFRYMEAPLEIVSNDGVNVSGIKLIKSEMGEPDSSGRRKPVPVPGSEFILECDYVMPAVSQSPDMSFISQKSGLRLTSWGTLDVNQRFETNLPGIFATGDYITGTRDVINVVADGHRTAISIDSYLRGTRGEYSRSEDLRLKEDQTPVKLAAYDNIARHHAENIPLNLRLNTFEEVERTLTKEEAMLEAARCFQCSHTWRYNSDTCILCNNCVDVCPQKCLGMAELTELEFSRLFNENISLKEQGITGIEIDRDLCIRCTFCAQVCPTDSIDFTTYEKPEVRVQSTIGSFKTEVKGKK